MGKENIAINKTEQLPALIDIIETLESKLDYAFSSTSIIFDKLCMIKDTRKPVPNQDDVDCLKPVSILDKFYFICRKVDNLNELLDDSKSNLIDLIG